MATQPNIYTIRNKKVVLDRDLAAALGVETRVVNQNFKRNAALFVDDSVFQLTKEECLISQILGSKSQPVILNSGRGSNLKHLPFAFTETGVQVLKTLMKSSVDIDFYDEPPLPTIYEESWSEGTVVLYQPNENLKIDVRVENETVWLTQEQMALLFGASKQNISLHIANVYEEKELEKWATVKEYLTVQTEGERQISRSILHYNLDVIISVGYRVKSIYGTRFRQWANQVLKQYLLHKGSFEHRVQLIENNIKAIEQQQIKNTNDISDIREQVKFVVDTKPPPTEMVFYEGENFKAYDFLCTLIESANKRIVLIDNYVDRKVFLMLNKRTKGVSVTVYTNPKNLSDPQIQLDLAEANKKREAPLIQMLEIKNDHDRFLIIDNTSYLLGPSIKDAGVNRCAVVKMISAPEKILKDLI
ncbi:MAG: ORF6N domain-containing protein [Paludibacteraceae bacterium]|nr:ORF6N domain-containing protein [Paludibacteraceae bacterium]